MIRIRGTDKRSATLAESFRFVEIADVDGKVACVIFADDNGVVHKITAADPEAAAYAARYGVKWCPLIKLPDSALPKAPTI